MTPRTPAPTQEIPGSSSRKRATLARLLAQARTEFSEKGLARARITDIARAAGVSKQLVYHYFDSKEQLFTYVLDASAQGVLPDLLALELELDRKTPGDALRILLEYAFDVFGTNPALAALTIESSRLDEHTRGRGKRFADLAPTLIHLLERTLRRGAATGEFVSGMDARLFCAASMLVTTGGFINRYIASTAAGFDTTSPEGLATWRRYSVDFVMAAVTAKRTSADGR